MYEIESGTWAEIERELEERSIEAELRVSYVGRGETEGCIAVVGDLGTLIDFTVVFATELARAAGDDDLHHYAETLSGRARQDSMGRETVFYFPGVTLVD